MKTLIKKIVTHLFNGNVIATADDYIGSTKQRVGWIKTTARTSVAGIPFTMFDLGGYPAGGTLAGANTANGVVPTDATAGFPTIDAFSGGAKGYISKVEFSNSVASRLSIYDCLFKAGAYSFNSNVTLASQPSFSSRVPNGTDYKETEIWIEAVTAFTGNLSIRIQYLDQDGNAGDTGTIALGVAPTVGRMIRIPLGSGDTGVSQITVVTATVSSAGTFNVLVLRPLWTSGRVPLANGGDIHDLLKTGLPEVFADSALYPVVIADSTSTGLPEMQIEIANK